MLEVTAEEFGMLCAQQEVSGHSIGSAIANAQINAQKQAPKAKAKGKTVADTIRQGIRDGLENKAILKAVHKKHKACKTTMACVYWYQSRFKRGLEK